MRQRLTTFVVLQMLLLFQFTDRTAKFKVIALRYSSRAVRTESGIVRGVIMDVNSKYLGPVEIFRGVPYAIASRYRKPQKAPTWNGTRIADNFGPVCPQRFPDITNITHALQTMTRIRLNYVQKFLTNLQNQSENCLTINIYVPGSGDNKGPYAVLVYVHGESFEWGSGNPYDGSVIASYGYVIVITINYRLGILGFLKTHDKIQTRETDYSCGNFALYDIIASLTWVQNNIAAFGGDPHKVTVFGHDTGAVLVNYLLISSKAKNLFSRAVLVSGSALSPWGTSQNADKIRQIVAQQTGCLQPPNAEDIAACLRTKSLKSLLDVRIDQIRFTSRFAVVSPFNNENLLGPEFAMKNSANSFPTTDLLIGTNSIESFFDFSELDMKYGFEEDQRNRILRTYIRNTYVYHLNEIFSAVKNEYTDWDKPIQHPFNIRDATMEALSDGHTISPLLKVALLHANVSQSGAKRYFFHFGYQTNNDDNLQRLGTIRGDDINYLFGMPFVSESLNFSKTDIAISDSLLHYLTNFIKFGNPNGIKLFYGSNNNNSKFGANNSRLAKTFRDVFWDEFQISSQLYLNIGSKLRMKNHFRGHKVALWLNLVPQLHQPGDEDVVMSHHHFYERDQFYYAGLVRAESFTKPTVPSSNSYNSNLIDCTPNTITPIINNLTAIHSGNTTKSSLSPKDLNDDFLQELTTQEYYGYRTALILTIGIGSLLLVLNVTIFLIIYCQKIRHRRDKHSSTGANCDEEEEEATNSCRYQHHGHPLQHFSCNRNKRVQLQDIDII